MTLRNMKTIEDVEEWLARLQKRNRLWHMDDDPAGVVWQDPIGPRELAALKRQWARAIQICLEADADIFKLYPLDWD